MVSTKWFDQETLSPSHMRCCCTLHQHTLHRRMLLHEPAPPTPCSMERLAFDSKCPCLARNTECDGTCTCRASACLNRAVGGRVPCVLGEDVKEIDTWGMDCYTRRNIHEGVALLCRCCVAVYIMMQVCAYATDGMSLSIPFNTLHGQHSS